MTLEIIKEAIVHLSGPERVQLAEWFEGLKEEEWDRKMEEDLSPGGRGHHLLEEVEAEIAAGGTKTMEEFLAEAEAKRDQSDSRK